MLTRNVSMRLRHTEHTQMAEILVQGPWDRKAGRYDYKRFDQGSHTSPSMGYQSIGKVNVGVRFLLRKSQWGTLGRAENAAGIIYLELEFDQPPDCELESAEIQLTLDEEDEGLGPYRVESLPPSDRLVLVTDFYGPGNPLAGTAKKVAIRKSHKLEPSANVLGNGGALGALANEKVLEHESRWKFETLRVPDRSSRRQSADRCLRWRMTENDIERSTRSNKVYTAFAYEHSGQPFLMKIEISGKLRKRGDRMKANLKKFGPRARKQEDISTTLVGAYLGNRRPLDELARGLASAMELENCMEAAVEVPEVQTASFQQVARDSISSTNSAQGPSSAQASGQTCIEGTTPQPELRLNGQTLDMLEDTPVGTVRDRTASTLENLARSPEYFTKSIRLDSQVIRGDVSEASGHSSDTTLVATQSEQSQPETQPESQPETQPESQPETQPESQPETQPDEEEIIESKSHNSAPAVVDQFDEDIMTRVMEVAMLRIFIQSILWVMDFFGAFGARKPEETQREKKTQRKRPGRVRHRRKET
ncbi:hypothetical protein KVR01_009177 [Diaporthe batatas]|uniref:uncharacterized protein n=1 Tax=Diaporthe batatas TaxID=748121 RepID=UPI001D0441E1|nr:uncharacterized protein KVR01_009177 [Diaporthe batatas]KAG8160913.1 hypothetical protein KVR01_009177 [Diaporthe batatas]